MKKLLIFFILISLFAGCEKDSSINSRKSPAIIDSDDFDSPEFRHQVTSDLQRKVKGLNSKLSAKGLGIAVESIEFYTIGQGRPDFRLHQLPFRWVANDPRREAQGEDITYLVDQTYQGTSSGVSAIATESEIDAAMATWNSYLNKVSIVKKADPGFDVTFFDEFFPSPDEAQDGFPFAADIVNAGWYPRSFFETVGGPGGGDGILAFSVSFIFTNPDGSPTDINGDQHLDQALNEVYFNDTFGKAGDPREGFPWATGQMQIPNIDIQTVALHENGHSLCLGHFGPPPAAVMNPRYAGPQLTPLPADKAGMNAVWSSWPK